MFIRILVVFVVLGLTLAEITTTVDFLPDACSAPDAKKADKGAHLFMHYTGSIDESSPTGTKGKVFDSSRTRGQAFDFTIGTGQVIKGWDEGLLGICEGEKRTLVIPSDMGYGDNGAGADIPGGATLKFEVECVKVGTAADRPPVPNIFSEIDANSDNELSEEEFAAWFMEKRGEDQIPDGLFASEDKDGDGKVSWEEFGGPKGEGNEEL
mgnify:CR=1 FL=1